MKWTIPWHCCPLVGCNIATACVSGPSAAKSGTLKLARNNDMAKSLKVFIEDICLVLSHLGPGNPRIKQLGLQTHLSLTSRHLRHSLYLAFSLTAASGF